MVTFSELLSQKTKRNTFFANNYQHTIKAINQYLGFDI